MKDAVNDYVEELKSVRMAAHDNKVGRATLTRYMILV